MTNVTVPLNEWDRLWEDFENDLFHSDYLCNVKELSNLRKTELQRRIEALKWALRNST